MEVHGHSTRVDKPDYPTEYRVKDKRGEWHVQCNCIVLVTINKSGGVDTCRSGGGEQ